MLVVITVVVGIQMTLSHSARVQLLLKLTGLEHQENGSAIQLHQVIIVAEATMLIMIHVLTLPLLVMVYLGKIIIMIMSAIGTQETFQ
jgi:hypothetical protein